MFSTRGAAAETLVMIHALKVKKRKTPFFVIRLFRALLGSKKKKRKQHGEEEDDDGVGLTIVLCV